MNAATENAKIPGLHVSGDGFRAEIALQGATLLNWQPVMPDGTALQSIVDGYATPEELQSQNGVRNGILAPFTNRIPEGRFDFAHRHHSIRPVLDQEALVFHGFARALPFTLIRSSTENKASALMLRADISPTDFAGYPYALTIEVEYRFHRYHVDIDVRGINNGPGPLPFAAGWHPYFCLPGVTSIDTLELTIPSRTVVATDERLIPLQNSDGHIVKRDDPSFLTAAMLENHVLDQCFTDLRASANGRYETRLDDRQSGSSLTVWQERGLMHVFTGDTLARDRRKSIALEPVEVPTNAFNLPELTEAITLQPGQTRSFKFGFRFEAGHR